MSLQKKWIKDTIDQVISHNQSLSEYSLDKKCIEEVIILSESLIKQVTKRINKKKKENEKKDEIKVQSINEMEVIETLKEFGINVNMSMVNKDVNKRKKEAQERVKERLKKFKSLSESEIIRLSTEQEELLKRK